MSCLLEISTSLGKMVASARLPFDQYVFSLWAWCVFPELYSSIPLKDGVNHGYYSYYCALRSASRTIRGGDGTMR